MSREPGGPTVLIADDAVFMRRHLRDLLVQGGARVVAEASDGDQVLELYETFRPDLVTLDVVMPRMDGLEALRALRSRHPEATVIVCSSLNDEQTIIEAIRLGARDYVVKPVDEEKLLDAVRKALRPRAAPTAAGRRDGL